jgi:hypothetical protein
MYLTFGIGALGILSWAFVNQGVSAGGAITGHITDRDTKTAVANAEITLSGRPEMARTDGAGNFTLTITNSPPPNGQVHLYISKSGYDGWDRAARIGQLVEAELAPVLKKSEVPAPKPPPPMQTTAETYYSDEAASGSCKDFGAWATVCTPDKPEGWTIAYQNFALTGDRAGCAYAKCEPLGNITNIKACYHFTTQGHDEECGHSGNTGIHYSKGVLNVVWSHP